jgi:hypothetical protein
VDPDVARVEAAIGEIESQPQAMEAVQAIVEMYGEGLARIVERVDAAALLDDELVEHLLLLHDLHPVPVEERVRGVLPDGVELVSIQSGVVRLRANAPCGKQVDEAIRRVAPDVEDIIPDDAELVLEIQVAGQERLG